MHTPTIDFVAKENARYLCTFFRYFINPNHASHILLTPLILLFHLPYSIISNIIIILGSVGVGYLILLELAIILDEKPSSG